jgi:hypothetical protein
MRISSAGASTNRPVFVLGERASALEMVRALGETPMLYALPMNRLLPDLEAALAIGQPCSQQGVRMSGSGRQRPTLSDWRRLRGGT